MEDQENARLRTALYQALEQAASIADELQALVPQQSITQDEWLRTLARLGVELARLRQAINDVSPAVGLPAGAHDRILRYLQLRVGEVVRQDELEGVAGISEWARRVRELRVQAGWQISTNSNREDLRPGEYVLESLEPEK